MRNEVIGQYMTHSEMGMCMKDVSGCMGYVLNEHAPYKRGVVRPKNVIR